MAAAAAAAAVTQYESAPVVSCPLKQKDFVILPVILSHRNAVNLAPIIIIIIIIIILAVSRGAGDSTLVAQFAEYLHI